MPSPWPDLTVNYAHSWTEIKKGIDNQGPYYKVQYYINASWITGDQIINELLGYAKKEGQSSFFQGPHQYPLDPTGRSLCCQAEVAEGVGAPILNSDGYPSYANGFIIDAMYRVPPIPMYEQNDPANLMGIDPSTPLLWASQDLDFTTDFILLDNSTYKYASDSSPSNVPIKIKTSVIVMDITFHRVPFMPTSLMMSAAGTVNNATFMSASAGQVLFKGPRTHRDINPDGSYIQSVQLVFHWRNKPWNQVFRPDTLAWDTLQDGSGNGPYLTSNLSSLLSLGQSYSVNG